MRTNSLLAYTIHLVYFWHNKCDTVRSLKHVHPVCVFTYWGLSRHRTDIPYPIVKPMSGSSAAAPRTSAVRIIHSMSLTTMADRAKTIMLEITRMLRPACWGQIECYRTLNMKMIWDSAFLLRLCGTHFSTHSFDDDRVLWFVVVNDNTDGTRHQGECKSSNDAEIWNSIFQTRKALAVDIEQQRH